MMQFVAGVEGDVRQVASAACVTVRAAPVAIAAALLSAALGAAW
jgi:hypothetical protein